LASNTHGLGIGNVGLLKQILVLSKLLICAVFMPGPTQPLRPTLAEIKVETPWTGYTK